MVVRRPRRKYGRRKRAYSTRRRAARKMPLLRRRAKIMRRRRGIVRRRGKRSLRFTNVFTPHTRLVKLRYNQEVVDSAPLWDGTGVRQQRSCVFSCNNTNNPSANAVPSAPNHQPMLYDQLLLFYDRNCVVGSNIYWKLRFHNQLGAPLTNLPPMQVIMARNQTGVFPPITSTDAAYELSKVNKDFRIIEFTPNGNTGVYTFKWSWSIRKQADVKDIKDNLPYYSSLFSNTRPDPASIPTKPWWWVFRIIPKYDWAAAGEVPAVTDMHVTISVVCNYITLCYERKNFVAQS